MPHGKKKGNISLRKKDFDMLFFVRVAFLTGQMTSIDQSAKGHFTKFLLFDKFDRKARHKELFFDSPSHN